MIIKGVCGVYQQSKEEGGKIASLSKFDVFGESALLNVSTVQAGTYEDSPNQLHRRNATVIVESENAYLLKLSCESYDALVKSGKFGGGEHGVMDQALSMRIHRSKSNSISSKE